MKKFLTLWPIIFLVGCSHFSDNSRQISSENQCPVDPRYPALFSVVENTSQKITVDLGDFAKFFKLADREYSYEVIFKGSKFNMRTKAEKAAPDPVVASGKVSTDRHRLVVPVAKTGVYMFVLFQEETGFFGMKKEPTPFWTQKVFAVAPAERTLKDEEKDELARKFAPIVSYHNDERYFPVSIPYLFNQVDADSGLAEEPFVIAKRDYFKSHNFEVEFKLKDLYKVLPHYGNHQSVMKSGLDRDSDTRLKGRFGKDRATIYYSVFESALQNEIYINYHFFYSYDPKNGTEKKDALPAHIYDRESMTMVLRKSTKQPIMVIYGAHLASQVMGELDAGGNVLQQWVDGKVYTNWGFNEETSKETIKMNGRPVPAIALGSHGIYPKKAVYAVLQGRFKLLTEPAGGDRYLYPDFITTFDKMNSTSFPYKLVPFKLENATSSCNDPYSPLVYSGSTVDVLGPVNATFPPYTDREEDYFSYTDPNMHMFELNKKAD